MKHWLEELQEIPREKAIDELKLVYGENLEQKIIDYLLGEEECKE